MNDSDDMLKRHTEVRVVPWNPKWHDMFLKEQAKLRGYLEKAGLKAEILHVGSTSVKDMWSKPIIDILILIPDKADPLQYSTPLSQNGVEWHGECGRPGRVFMSEDEEEISFYIHVTTRGNPVAQDQLLFQKLEREDATIRWNYIRVKQMAAARYPDDRSMYREMKGLYIEGVLAAYRHGQR